jgi:hypothetical protein
MSLAAPSAADRKQLRALLGEYRESGRSMRAEQALAIHQRRLTALAKLAATILQRFYRGWVQRKRQIAKLRVKRSVERELGITFEDAFTVVLRNVNNCAAVHDDGLRKARQKQQRKTYLVNLLRVASASGSFYQLAGGSQQRPTDVAEEKVPQVKRAALMLQLGNRAKSFRQEAAVVTQSSSRVSGSAHAESPPGQVLYEILAKVCSLFVLLHCSPVSLFSALMCDIELLQHANNTQPLQDALVQTDSRTQRRRDRMLAASVQERIPDLMTLGSVVAAANAVGGGEALAGTASLASGKPAAASSGAPGVVGSDGDMDYYFHGAISEGPWLAMLAAAGFLNDTVGLGAAHALFTQHAVVLRVRTEPPVICINTAVSSVLTPPTSCPYAGGGAAHSHQKTFQ